MENTYWHRQTKDAPLFPDLLWSRPENRRHAGKLLIIGGNSFGFAVPGEAYTEAVKAGVGIARVLLPDAVKAVAKHALETVEFAPSTPSGSFNRKALAEMLDHAHWADGTIMAGDLGRNSETAIVIESFLQKYSGPLTVTKDAVEYMYSPAKLALSRGNMTIVLTIAQLQKLARAAGHPKAVTFGMDFLQLIEWLHEFTNEYPINIVVKHLDTVFVASGGQVSTTKQEAGVKTWRVRHATHAAVWWLQHSARPFEAITTAIIN